MSAAGHVRFQTDEQISGRSLRSMDRAKLVAVGIANMLVRALPLLLRGDRAPLNDSIHR
jgi:hypothetical protein